MAPVSGKNIQFTFDRAFNYRMTAEVMQKGDVPEIDRLSTYPDGKNVKKLLPVGMYYACALFHILANIIYPGTVLLSRSILYFCSLCGALIFIPVYFISREVYKSRLTAYITGFLASVMPAYLNRSVCTYYRFEILGIPLLCTSLLFFIKAFGALNTRKTILYAVLSGIFMVLSLGVWRLSILFVIAYAITLGYTYIRRKDLRRTEWTIFFILSGFILFFAATSPHYSGINLFKSYGNFPNAIIQLIQNKIGIAQKWDGFTRLVIPIGELNMLPLPQMFGRNYFSFAAVFILVYFIAYFTDKARSVQKDILFVFMLFFFILTTVFLRISVFLAPLAAIALGESITLARKNKKTVKNILIAVIVAILMKTGYDAYRDAALYFPYCVRSNPYLDGVLYFVNKNVPKDAVILCDWADGYPIQTYSGRATITDGLFESNEIAARILGAAKIYYFGDEESLWSFCRKYGATYLLLDSSMKAEYALYAGLSYDDYKKYYAKDDMPTASAKALLIYKLEYEPEQFNKFRLLYKNDHYLLYAVQ